MTFSGLTLTAHDAPLLGINIDHVATVRNARGGRFPDPVAAALLAVEACADIITFHLREDRRHIRDDDVARLKALVHAPLNFEAAVTDEMLDIIERTAPAHVCLVPERRQEVTTEGGLDVVGQFERVREACARLAAAGSRVSLFIGADLAQIERLQVPGKNGNVMLAQVATVSLDSGPAEINRLNRMRNVILDVELASRQLGELNEEARALPALQNLPASVRMVELGDAQEMQALFASFGIAMLIGVLCIYGVLVLLFPHGIAGGAHRAWLRGREP